MIAGPRRVPMLLVLGLAAALVGPVAAQFQVFEWTYSGAGTGSGSVSNEVMIIVGPDESWCSGATNAFTAVAPYDLVVVADFDVDNSDKVGFDFDYLVTLVDGVESFVSGGCFGCQVVLEVPAGSTFGFGVHSVDCVLGEAEATLTNLLVQPAPGAAVAAGDHAAAQFGTALAAFGDLDGDGALEVAVGAPNAGGGKGSVSLLKGSDLAVLRTLKGVAADDHLGASVGAVGDVDGDGFGELLVGVPDADLGGEDSGAAQLHSGASGTLLASFAGAASGDHFGAAVSSAGDQDGDGVDDLLVGAPQHDGPGVDAGQATVVSGATRLPLHVWSGATGDNLGHALAGVGDVDGDGVPDVAIGSPLADPLGIDSGLAQIVSGATGLLMHALAPEASSGPSFDLFGSAVAGLGDANGDGVPDVAVGAPDDHNGGLHKGRAYVFSGADGQLLMSVSGSESGHHLGAALAGVGDVNDDGRVDLLIGSPANEYSPEKPGRVQLVTAIDGGLLQAFGGEFAADSYGRAVAPAGDANGDGRPDLLVGAPATDTLAPGVVASLRPSFLWADLGHALPGMLGPPSLQPLGLLAAGTPLVLSLADSPPGLPVTLVVGPSQLGAPFKGGVLVPQPQLLIGLVSATPALAIEHDFPPGVDSGTELFIQAWIADLAGPKGLAASNAVRGTVP